jgi:hypothetical protein
MFQVSGLRFQIQRRRLERLNLKLETCNLKPKKGVCRLTPSTSGCWGLGILDFRF